jgi:hypothetical protein
LTSGRDSSGAAASPWRRPWVCNFLYSNDYNPVPLAGLDLTTHKLLSPQAETILLDHVARAWVSNFFYQTDLWIRWTIVFLNRHRHQGVMLLKIFSPPKIRQKLVFLTRNKVKLCENFISNDNFFRRKLAKIAENSDHNINPRLSKSDRRRIDFFVHNPP